MVWNVHFHEKAPNRSDNQMNNRRSLPTQLGFSPLQAPFSEQCISLGPSSLKPGSHSNLITCPKEYSWSGPNAPLITLPFSGSVTGKHLTTEKQRERFIIEVRNFIMKNMHRYIYNYKVSKVRLEEINVSCVICFFVVIFKAFNSPVCWRSSLLRKK